MKSATLLALLVAAPLLGSPASQATIAVSPAAPKAGESVVVTVNGLWAASCPPKLTSAKLSGHTFTIESSVPVPCAPCAPIITPFTVTAPAVTFADAATYTIEFAYTECDGSRTLLATKQIVVNPGCAFDRSLTVSTGSAAVGDTVGFSWCDPSETGGADTGRLATAYRVFLVRAGDAPILVSDQPASAGTHADVTIPTTGAGATAVFVEALMCENTIAGCRPAPPAKTNVVPLAVAAGGPCSFGGQALCLGNRFSVTARWRLATTSGPAHPVSTSANTGTFWFFSADNVELVVKMVDACGTPLPRFWFFAAGLTDVGVDLVVTDTKSGIVRRYSSPSGSPFLPVQDTNAFATCAN